MTVATPAPVRELGTAGGSGSFWQVQDEESAPELRWPLSVDVFDRMRRQDAQVVSVLRAVTLPVRRTTWRLDGTGCRPQVAQHVAQDLGLPLAGQPAAAPVSTRSRDRFAWAEHLRLALLMLPFGHMFFEQVYRIGDDGLAHLRKLGPRLPRSIEAINVAPDGGLESIVQHWSGQVGRAPEIPVNRLVAYVHEREGGNWLGNSLLRPAYKNWLIKDRLLRTQAQTVDRNGMGVPVYTAGSVDEDLTVGRKMAQDVRSGDNSGAGLPMGSKLELLGVSGTLPDADKPIRYHDEQIARAVLAHFLNLGTQTGSWALGSTFADFFTLSLQTVGQQVADTATHHIVEDLVDVNWGPDEPAPRIVFDEIGSRRDATADALKVLTDAGIIRTDRDLEEFVRTSFGLPPKPADQPAPAPVAAP